MRDPKTATISALFEKKLIPKPVQEQALLTGFQFNQLLNKTKDAVLKINDVYTHRLAVLLIK